MGPSGQLQDSSQTHAAFANAVFSSELKDRYTAPVCSRPGLVRQPTKTRHSLYKRLQHAQLTISLSFFIGKARTVLEAGFALKTHGSLVNGFTPLRAGLAGFFFNFKFKAPATLKEPFL